LSSSEPLEWCAGRENVRKFLALDRDFLADCFSPIREGPLEGANPVEIRTLVALAATLVCAAMAAHATSEVQTAREQQPAPLPANLDDPAGALPESPLVIADPRAADAPLQIQLGAADAEPSSTGLLDLSFELSPP
jgi:hypothetical protein